MIALLSAIAFVLHFHSLCPHHRGRCQRCWGFSNCCGFICFRIFGFHHSWHSWGKKLNQIKNGKILHYYYMFSQWRFSSDCRLRQSKQSKTNDRYFGLLVLLFCFSNGNGNVVQLASLRDKCWKKRYPLVCGHLMLYRDRYAVTWLDFFFFFFIFLDGDTEIALQYCFDYKLFML